MIWGYHYFRKQPNGLDQWVISPILINGIYTEVIINPLNWPFFSILASNGYIPSTLPETARNFTWRLIVVCLENSLHLARNMADGGMPLPKCHKVFADLHFWDTHVGSIAKGFENMQQKDHLGDCLHADPVSLVPSDICVLLLLMVQKSCGM